MSIYSSRLGHITPEQFQAALDRFNLGAFLEAQAIRTGLFGQNVFITSTSGQYVLRGDPHYPWQFPKERFFARLLHGQTSAPVPWPYLLDPSTDIFGWSYLLMPRLPGIPTADPEVRAALSPSDKQQIAAALGETLAQMHQCTWPHPGEHSLERDSIVPLPAPYADWLSSEIRHILARTATYTDRTTPADFAWVESILARSRSALSLPFTASCVMRDFNYNNTVAQQTDGRWRISGVFDLMECYFGNPEADLSRQVAMYLDDDPSLARTYVQSYLGRHPPAPGFADRYRAFMLHDRLIVWEYGQRNHMDWWDRRLTLRQWAETYTDAVGHLV